MRFGFRSISNAYFVWITGERNHIGSGKIIIRLYHFLANFRERDTIVTRCIHSSCFLNWLKYNTANAVLILCELYKFFDFIVIDSFLNHTYETSRNTIFLKHGKCFFTNFPHISIADFHERIGTKRIKLKIYFKSWSEVFEFLYKCFILCDSNPIGIDHQVAHWPGFEKSQNLQNLRV